MFESSVAKAVGLKLLPFIKFSLIYVLLRPEPSWVAIVCKCLPILCLCGFVLNEIRLLSKKGLTVIPRYHIAILAGLILSCIGDGFLVYVNHYFIQGLLFFALAHIMYIYAFGANPLNGSMLVPLAMIACAGYGFMYPGLAAYELSFLGGVYTLMLLLMTWRAFARLQFSENLWTWTKMAACVGALLFCLSDFVLAANKFRVSIPSSESIVMTTYYSAQLGIALSVVNYSSEKKEK